MVEKQGYVLTHFKREYYYVKHHLALGVWVPHNVFSAFSSKFSKGDNFCNLLFASMEDEPLPIGVYSERKEFAPLGENSFL